MNLLLTVGASLIYLALVEYGVHRWYMHGKGTPQWRPHAIEHHQERRNDDEYLCPFWSSIAMFWAAGSMPLFFVAPYGPIILGLVMIWWRAAWNQIHRLAHGTGDRWILATVLCPWAPLVVRHHLRHHARPSSNFGAIFFLTDYLFGTKK